ncbi:7777_t:CDS:2 [Ambispora gerdemannii]|uniref:7777_t:CDS:1 n=1 Tax=Ambispora gerdemannii TaxID=144530 RepID=A0A9N8V0A3_9GLOM|nr:7777_t:CDS:2 [Ambispora gerdemannii]
MEQSKRRKLDKKAKKNLKKERPDLSKVENNIEREKEDALKVNKEIGELAESQEINSENDLKEIEEKANEEDESSEYDSEDIIAGQKRKKSSRKSTSTADEFAESMNKILSSQVKTINQKAPILSRSKGIEKRIDEERLEYRARKALNAEKKKFAAKDRVPADYNTADHERKLKKVATRGVVKLFNAIREAQKTAEAAEVVGGGKDKLSTRQAKDVASMSKATFLDALKGGIH